MCNISGIIWGMRNLTRQDVFGKKVIEVGSYNVNGSFRSFLTAWSPSEYTGVDISDGPGVDVVCNAEKITDKFGKERFDIVISTELLEHVQDWRKVISNLKDICKPDGLILISTRSHGFPYHGYPHDFWRYEIEDMTAIFADCEILSLEKDQLAPGVFLKVRKPQHYIRKDLQNYPLYNIVKNNKTILPPVTKDYWNAYFLFNIIFKIEFKRLLHSGIDFIFSFL